MGLTDESIVLTSLKVQISDIISILGHHRFFIVDNLRISRNMSLSPICYNTQLCKNS